jgi:hypothetical protein
MRDRYFLRMAAALVVMLCATACQTPQPFVYKEEEFDRRKPTFRKDPTVLNEVIVCYNKNSATPQAVVDLAKQQCSIVGKVPQFNYQQYFTCPMTTPVAAHYNCVSP